MGKGSSPRPFTDREVFESNFDKIFGKTKKVIDEHNELFEMLKQSEEQDKKNIDPITKPFPHNILKQSRMDTVGQNGNTGEHYEYELNKSTGEVEKTYSRIDVISQNGNEGLHYPESLDQGTSKPNNNQFDNIKDE